MAKQPRQRTRGSRVRWAAFGLGLVLVMYLLYFQFAAQPSLWETLTNGANY